MEMECGLWVSKKVKDPIDWNNVAQKYETYVSSFQYYFPVKSYSLIPAKPDHNGNYCAGLNLQFRPSFRISHSKDKDPKH